MYIYKQTVLKQTEGGIGVATIKDVLKGLRGTKVTSYPSVYVGHSTLEIETQTHILLNVVLRNLVDFGYVSSRASALEDCVWFPTE